MSSYIKFHQILEIIRFQTWFNVLNQLMHVSPGITWIPKKIQAMVCHETSSLLIQHQLEHLHGLVGPAWGERTPLCTSLARKNTGPTQGNEIYKNEIKWSWRDKCIFCRTAVVSFLLPCSWICCCFVYPTLFRLRFSFWLLVGSTSLVPVGPFLLHAVLAVDMK